MKKILGIFIVFIAGVMILTACAQKAFYYPDHEDYGSHTQFNRIHSSGCFNVKYFISGGLK
ncbi:hypothetical protein [Wielerella bovis]|uniref:hypothetical protein n=1 Tax=Wielerella bovis TaxID=2917790 RepID=UPI0020186D0A|nr:hypothetical protein [Wielerella bovis]MCG7656294.1 hypothetical protein [Wielerella bovis]MCG7658519.1 hypothetical protein [Wielerella bovis]ULJ69627.1 hypothetical protein MIS45_01825 [Wielerella bovis]